MEPPQDPEPQPAPRPVRSARPLVAGAILLFLFGLGAFQGILQLAFTPEPGEVGLTYPDFPQTVDGIVTDAAGRPVANVSVASGAVFVLSEANGSFRLEGLPLGFVEVTFRHPDYANLTLRMFLLRAETVDVRLPTVAHGERVDEHESIDRQVRWAKAWGLGVLSLAAFAMAGAVSCYQRKRRPLAIVGAVAGTIAALPLGLLLGPAALVMILLRRTDWA